MITFIVSQIRTLLSKKTTIAVYFILFGMVIINYIDNVLTYRGYDLLQMYHPMELVLLTGDNFGSYYILQFFTFLVVLAGGWSYFDDHSSGIEIFLMTRMGANRYYIGKVISVFLATGFVFFIPFILEVVLNMIAFPLDATGNLGNLTIYDAVLEKEKSKMLWSGLYDSSRYLYAIVRALQVGITAGILGAFTVSISFLKIFKFRVFLFLPSYILTSLLFYIGMIVKVDFNTEFTAYLKYYDSTNKSVLFYIGVLCLLMLCTSLFTLLTARKDVFN